MEKIDPKTAKKVWQRVQAETAPTQDARDLLELIQEELSDAAGYALLSRGVPEKYRQALRLLQQQALSHAACLKGIYTLITGSKPTAAPLPAEKEPLEVALRKCYGKNMRRLARYEKWAQDVQFCQIFTRLTREEWEHCRKLLELLGSI